MMSLMRMRMSQYGARSADESQGVFTMSKVLVTSDWHFWKKSCRSLEDTTTWIIQQIRELKPDLVVFGGDLVHLHNHVETDVMHYIAKCVSDLATAAHDVTGKNLVAISGNHDTALRGMQKNIVEAIATLSDKVDAYTEPHYLEGFDMLLIPYPDGSQEFIDKVAELGTSNRPATAVVHVELSDVRYTPASKHETDHPFTIPESVKTILAGHYHHPETKVIAGKTLHVVGSPIYHNYSDRMVDIPRGALIFDTATHAVTRLNNPHGQVFHTAPSSQVLSMISGMDPTLLAKTHMRVNVESKEDYDATKPAIEQLRGMCASLRVIGNTAAVTQVLHREETKTLDMNNPMELLQAFCKKNTIEPDLASVGKAILGGLSK
jgi:UDP-2,3-diacylglucosamine pyrophosphatase LpxH